MQIEIQKASFGIDLGWFIRGDAFSNVNYFVKNCNEIIFNSLNQQV